MTMQYEEKYFDDGQNKIKYFQIGSGNVLLFLPGGVGGISACRKFLDLLSKKYLVIVLDSPCYEISKALSGISEYYEIMKKFINSLNFEKIAIIGHSIGGVVALKLSVENKKIPLLVLIDSAGISLKMSIAMLLYKIIIEKPIREILMYKNLNTLLLYIRDSLENMFKRFYEWKKIKGIIKTFLFTDFSEFYKIKAKTLILWGEQDEIFSKNNAEIFHQNIKNSEVKYIKGGHNWFLFNPERFYNIVINWLKENDY
jgi:pimeloyl-ACP methyl ester carboxylesterase